ncbi:MAG TPA: hypothetical protein VH520_06735 [Streptosporangiaceae bacterium]
MRLIIHDKRVNRELAGPSGGESGRRTPRVYVHVGEPKTGTTFLQDVLWANRRLLSARGIVLPGYNQRDHIRARRDLRDEPRQASDLADPWVGEWDVLAGQALSAPVAAVISDELLSAATERQVERAVRSLAEADLHVILTARALDAVLPTEWQESVKCGASTGWDAWLRSVDGTASAPDRRDLSEFWASHDTLAILQLWSRHVPADHVHIITTPRQRSPQLLWARFASVLGIDPSGIDLSQARSNSSLGYAETEFLRRVNEQLMADVPDWFYTRNVKSILAYGVLGTQPGSGRPALPSELLALAAGEAERLCAGLADSGVQVEGDLSELLADRDLARGAQHAAEPAEMVDAAVASAVALASQMYQHMYPARQPRRPLGAPRQALIEIAWRVLHGRIVQSGLRRASHLRTVRRLRVAIWRVLMRPGRQRLPVPARPADVLGVGSASKAA